VELIIWQNQEPRVELLKSLVASRESEMKWKEFVMANFRIILKYKTEETRSQG
jgi:hypothetical protein